MSTSTAKAVYTSSYRSRDKYGRSVTNFVVNAKTVAVVVTMPKAYAEKYGYRYLVNDWASETKGDVSEYVKRADAVQKAGQIVTREVAKA